MWKNRYQKQSFADFKLGVLKNRVNSTRKGLGLVVCNSIKKRLQNRFLPVKFAKLLGAPFFTRVPVAASEVWIVFSKKFGGKPSATVSKKHQIQLKKKYLLPQKSKRSHHRCSLKECLQGPAQVFSCDYCEIFKNTYFEKRLWTAVSKNQHLRDKFTEGR